MTPEQAKKMLLSLATFSRVDTPVILQKRSEVTKQMIKTRIFGEGLNTSYSDIGIYSGKWSKKRKAKGLQTAYVDLKYTGQ